MTANPDPTKEMGEAVEAAKRMLALFDNAKRDSWPYDHGYERICRALLSLRAEVVEECARAVESIPPCPFGKDAPAHDLEPTDPCPVCGDLGTFNSDEPVACRSPSAFLRSLLLKDEGEQ